LPPEETKKMDQHHTLQIFVPNVSAHVTHTMMSARS
jgi:hypothetical protein